MEETSMKKNFLFISCEEAYYICDKSQYGEATLWEKIKLNLRYIWCRFTQAYVKQNKGLTKAIKASNVQCLQKSEREQMVKTFNRELKNQM
jgi:O-acetyl-ADP-ribose deacetylase (regulator of RNase III)